MILQRMRCALLCLLLAACPLLACAEDAAAAPEATDVPLVDQAIEEGVAEEDLPTDEDAAIAAVDEVAGPPSIAGLKPLYTTVIKMLTATGKSVAIRYAQDTESKALGSVASGKTVTIYKVLPSFVLIEYQGVVGYILRTCIDENCVAIDPANTVPYGVMPMAYVATTKQSTPVYQTKDVNGDTQKIVLGEGVKVAIIGFEDGFAKTIYWRSYGYIPADRLCDLVVVSPTEEPLSDETPIAAFTSFFEYGLGTEANTGRVLNIIRSCELMTRVMQPGEQLDFNADIGPYKRTNGYYPAPVLIGGGSQLGYGGGTCQSSSTLYNAIRQLPGITVLYRRPHGPGSARYLPQHTDAAVGNTSLNLIFRNDYDFPIRIVAESKGEGTLTIMIYKGE